MEDKNELIELKKIIAAQAAEIHDFRESIELIEEKVLDCSTYLIKTLQILERVVPFIVPEDTGETGDFSVSAAISALEYIKHK